MQSSRFKKFKTICPKCNGNGQKRQRVKKSLRLKYKKAFEKYQNSDFKSKPPTPPVGSLSVCKNCHGTGLIASDSPTAINNDYPHIAIVGAGIGGNALAVACYHRGIPFTLYERDKSFDARAQGYGLTLQQASKEIKALGIDELKDGIVSTLHQVFYTDGNLIGEWGMRKWLNYKNYKPNKKTNIHIARQKLRAALMQQLGTDADIQWNHRLIDVKTTDNQASELLFQVDDKHICQVADLIVGADGIRSTVRNFWLKAKGNPPLRYLDCMVILGICPLAKLNDVDSELLDLETVFQTANGKERIYMMPYDKETIMWQLSFPFSEENAIILSEKGSDALKEEAIKRTHWHSPIPEILKATTTELISGYPVYDRDILDLDIIQDDLPITCIGDAAHPMSPFKGQGANQALLDALTLARSIAKNCNSYSNWKKVGLRKLALNHFEDEMIARSASKVKDSAAAAKFLHSEAVLHPANEPRGRCLKNL